MLIERGSEHHERSVEGALRAEAKLRTKEDAQGVLESEEEVLNRLVLLACEKSHAALIVVSELLDAPPDEGQPVLLDLVEASFLQLLESSASLRQRSRHPHTSAFHSRTRPRPAHSSGANSNSN